MLSDDAANCEKFYLWFVRIIIVADDIYAIGWGHRHLDCCERRVIDVKHLIPFPCGAKGCDYDSEA
jgi:hypothetical protein